MVDSKPQLEVIILLSGYLYNYFCSPCIKDSQGNVSLQIVHLQYWIQLHPILSELLNCGWCSE